MSIVKLRERVVETKAVQVETKPELRALKCGGCGKVFRMGPFCNDTELAVLHGTFDKVGYTGDGTTWGCGRGNGFRAIVCSFACADEVFKGGWKRNSLAQNHRKCGCKLVRASLKITSFIKEEEELIEEWEQKDAR